MNWFSKFNNRLNHVLFQKVDATGLAVFRICFSFVLILQVAMFFRFKHMIFDRVPFVYVGEIEPNLMLGFWMASVVCLFLGLFTKPASVVNYCFAVLVLSSNKQWEVHVFYSYVGISFLMMFLPLGKRFSLDNLIDKFKYSSSNKLYEPNYLVSAVNYIAPIFIGIGFMYFDSVFFKLDTYMWTHSIGMWMPATIPAATWVDTSFILNQEYLVKFLNYFVLVFEALFIILMWSKPFRLPLALIGIGFHIGIGITYPIPYFAAAYISMYLLLLPLWVWKKLGSFFEKFWPFKTPQFQVGDKASLNKAIIYDHFLGPRRFSNNDPNALHVLPSLPAETFYRWQWKSIFLIVIGLQIIISWFSPYTKTLRHENPYKLITVVTHRIMEPLYLSLRGLSTKYLGITHHGVFVDHHFKGFNHIFRAEFVDNKGDVYHVPILDKNGLVDDLVIEQTWRNIAFETITQFVRQDIFEPNIKLFLLQYFYEYRPKNREGYFRLYGKNIKVAKEWEYDMLKKNMEAPWFSVGQCHFEGDQLIFDWNQNMIDILEKEKKDPYSP